VRSRLQSPLLLLLLLLQVQGQFGIQLSARMSSRQARSQAVRSACAYTFRSRPRVRGSARSLLRALRQNKVDTSQAVRAMKLDQVLAANPGLNGTGVRIGGWADASALQQWYFVLACQEFVATKAAQ
jgi:hypothetical protein